MGLNYQSDNLNPEYNVGFGVSLGGGAPAGVSVTGAVASPGACTTCGTNRLMGSLSLPIILIGVAVLVLAFRR